jgi:DNA-binding MarR family transcriptional regulator
MDSESIRRVRSFNRAVTQAVGALDQSYLERGRPLGEARVLFEIGAKGADARSLRGRLGLDSGYLSRLLRALEAQGLIAVGPDELDGRRRRVRLTRKGRAEVAAYDALSDRLAASLIEPLDETRRARLIAAMGEVERLLDAAAVTIDFEPPTTVEARFCLESYFRELAERFEGGYEPSNDLSAPAEDLAPPSGQFVLARRMLRRLESEAARMGFAVLRLDTNKALSEAHALYLREGYRDIARFSDNPYAHRWFEKRLAPPDRRNSLGVNA